MREVKVKREELLARLRQSLETHVRDYQEACEGYRARAAEAVRSRRKEIAAELDRLAKRLDGGEILPLMIDSPWRFDLAPPESHEKDYRQIIEMIEMSVDEVITLRSDEFACYVLDDWEWKREFESVKTMYAFAKKAG